MAPLEWLRRRDAGLTVLRRAARTAVVTPVVFGVAIGVIGNPTVATYAAFGCFALLLFADFTGPMADRVRAQAGLGVAGAAFIALGTLVAPITWLAALTTAVLAFAVFFAGVVSSVLAGATTALLLPFILSSSLPAPPSAIPTRLAGWGLATAASIVAILVLWPAPVRSPLRARIVEACHALADRLRNEVAAALDLPGGTPDEVDAACARAASVIAALKHDFYGSPYRPTGLSTGDRALVRLVDELTWLSAVIAAGGAPGPTGPCRVRFGAALALREGAELLESRSGDPATLHAALESLRAEAHAVEDGTVSDGGVRAGFRAQEIGFAAGAIAANIEVAALAERRTLPQRLLGWQPSGIGGPLAAARERAAAHLEAHSVWLHNSIRAAAGLALAVLAARLTGVEHAFWVVLGALAVLRSNALNTGQTVLRAVLGTFAGIIAGGALIAVMGPNRLIAWALLPPAILLAGLAPAVVSFAAGQAAFTVVLFVLFNLIDPTGWRVGLVRLEDVALGCAVSLAVGLLLWPRGAGRALNVALAEAYAGSADYLRAAVDYGVAGGPPPRPSAVRAAAAGRRMDDAFRTYLGERGAKPVPMTDVSRLVGGVVGLRLAADAIVDLWSRADGARDGAAAQAEDRARLRETGSEVAGWYDALAAALTGTSAVPDPLPPDTAPADPPGATPRLVWTGGHLDAARRLQPSLLGPAASVTASA
ncbi:FUSC family protein [Dactylosporangium sp. CA-139066]|uniref:FUSC family protein n=1 Tax=Dactylosporangium sp. CA-139066 TaxID=3239930 RepID=UPI003D931616